MDFKAELQQVGRLFAKQEYTASAARGVAVIEQVMRHILQSSLPQLAEADQINVRKAMQRRGQKHPDIEKFTMGQLVNVVIESNFLDAWARMTGKDPSRARLYDLDELRKLRNKFAHELRQATGAEAEFLLKCLCDLLEDFQVLSAEELQSLAPDSARRATSPTHPVSAPVLGFRLEQADFQALTQLLQNLPEFGIERERRRLVAGALEGVPNAEKVLARLDLGGSPMGAAIETVRLLQGFGQVADGKQALGVFLNFIKSLTGTESAKFIEDLFRKYPLDAALIADRPLDHWRGTDSPDAIKEKIIGENTLRHIYFLERALQAARAVAHLRVHAADGLESCGTGFLIAANLLMTNHHVIATPQAALATEYSFNYQLGLDGRMLDVTPAHALAEGLFYTNPAIDFTILQLAGEPGLEFGYLRLKPIRVRKDERVSIIQHPGGHFKQISMQNNFVAYADDQIVHYTTSTLPGSSGSPVMNDVFDVIALHHSGGELQDPATGRYELRNAGASSCAILKDVEQHAPDIYRLLEEVLP